ncbi:GTPase ObgE [Candidatus Bipolaricaulota bacterium]
MLIDEATVRVRGGRGGNGVIHFMSSRHNPRGGPDGGSGGAGGSVILRASGSLSTLYPFRSRPLLEAESGVDGAGNTCQGARGDDCIVHVPAGTIIRDSTTGELLADLSCEGDEVVVAQGGEGGRGNSRFVTSRRQGPRICERGLGGEARTLRLELKLIADVGIIGYPNVGKSSLISTISAVKAKVADYPFTTIVPNLGVVDVDGVNQFVAVDVPGLIEGAHEGRGLGDRFLRHVERTKMFIHMVDLAALEGRDPVGDYQRINEELTAFNPALGHRPQIVVGNKIDLLDDEAIEEARARFREIDVAMYPISVATLKGVREIAVMAYRVLEGARTQKDGAAPVVRRRVYRYRGETGFEVRREEERFVVTGDAVEKLVKKLVLDSRDAMEYLGNRLEKMGVLKELKQQGFSAGDLVTIGGIELELKG